MLSRAICALGVVAVVVMVSSEDPQTVLGLLARVGWHLSLLPFFRLLPLCLDVMGWRLLLPQRVGLAAMILIASIREAINSLLPVASIGGEVVGVALLRRQGVPTAAATASIIVELLLTMMSQLFFALFSLLSLYHTVGNTAAGTAAALALSASLPVLMLIMASLASGSLFQRIQKIAAWVCRALGQNFGVRSNWALVDRSLRELMRSPLRLGRTFVWQLSGHTAACLETWLVLRWLGVPTPLVAVVAIEGLTQAIRSLFFVVPGGLGVQEAGLIGIGYLLHIDPATALALALAKRCREVLFGLPALGVWQLTEIRGVGRALPSGDR